MMKRLFIPLCLIWSSYFAVGQRSYQFSVPDRLFVEGKELFDAKNYTGCIDKLREYKQQSVDLADLQEADYILACAAFEQGHPEAANLLKEYLDTYPETHRADQISFYIGSFHFGRREYEKAAFWLDATGVEQISKDQQKDRLYRLAFSLLQSGDVSPRARSYFTEIQKTEGSPYREVASYYIAYLDYAAGRYNQALAAFSRLQSYSTYKKSSHYLIAQIYFMQGKYDDVIAEGEDILKIYEGSEANREIHHITGNSYYFLGEWQNAIKHLSQYVGLADTSQHSEIYRNDLYLLGISYFNNEKYPNAIKYLKQAVSEDDDLTQNAYFFLGQAYLYTDDKSSARRAFEAAAAASFDIKVKEVATYNYAMLAHETAFTGFGESIAIFENFLTSFPNSKYSDKVNDHLVEAYLTNRNYEAALASVDKISQPNQRILTAKQIILFQLGTQAFANQNMEEAIKLLTRSIELGDNNIASRDEAYFWRGESFYRQGQYQNSVTDYQTYIRNILGRNESVHALCYYNLGYAYFKMKRYDDALNNLLQYTNAETDIQAYSYADAYSRIGDCLFHNRLFGQADEYYSRAVSLQPSIADYALLQKGYIAGVQQDYTGKIAAINRLLIDFPDSHYIPDALYEKGRTYVLLGNSDDAAEVFAELMSRFPQNSRARKAGVQLGLLHYNNDQLGKAAEAYKKVITTYPDSEEARVAMQDLKSIYIDLGDIPGYAAYANSLGGVLRVEVSEQDSLSYITGERLYMRGDREGAFHSLSAYLQNYPGGAFSVRASYYLANIYFVKREFAAAKPLYTFVLESKDSKFMEDCWARKADIEYMERNFAEALQSYKQLRAIAENQQNQEAAKIGVMRCAQLAKQSREALETAEEILKGTTKLSPEIALEARFIRAKALIDMGQSEQAMLDLLELSKDTRTAAGAESKYLVALYYYDADDIETAEAELLNFIENGTPHQYWLARGFILLADIYIKKSDEFQARQYLASLKNNYKGDDDIENMIQIRLAKLKK